MKVHLINPSSVSFGTAVITPRWQYVLAGATRIASAIQCWWTKLSPQLDPDSDSCRRRGWHRNSHRKCIARI